MALQAQVQMHKLPGLSVSHVGQLVPQRFRRKEAQLLHKQDEQYVMHSGSGFFVSISLAPSPGQKGPQPTRRLTTSHGFGKNWEAQPAGFENCTEASHGIIRDAGITESGRRVARISPTFACRGIGGGAQPFAQPACLKKCRGHKRK